MDCVHLYQIAGESHLGSIQIQKLLLKAGTFLPPVYSSSQGCELGVEFPAFYVALLLEKGNFNEIQFKKKLQMHLSIVKHFTNTFTRLCYIDVMNSVLLI